MSGLRLSTDGIAPSERQEWLREVICREYTNVSLSVAPKSKLHQNLVIYPWDKLQLSVIQSSPIGLDRLPQEPTRNSQDAYFAVILAAGKYAITQNGREVFLQPGDMTIYDATRPHHIQCPEEFAKLIIAIPRSLFRSRIASIDAYTALRIPGLTGAGLIASSFIRTLAGQTANLSRTEFSKLADQALDLLSLAITSVSPANLYLSRSRTLTLNRIKAIIEQQLSDPSLNATQIAHSSGLSSRYINNLFADEDTSLMRYVWKRRLDHCKSDMLDTIHACHSLTDIAYRWGFNDLAHFSRAFKQQQGCSPREFRRNGPPKKPGLHF